MIMSVSIYRIHGLSIAVFMRLMRLARRIYLNLFRFPIPSILNRVATIPKSKLNDLREGLLIISGCEKGEFFEAVMNKSMEEAEEVARYYDVLEIQPVSFYMHLVEKGFVAAAQKLSKRSPCL